LEQQRQQPVASLTVVALYDYTPGISN
jgi:hypothetical protein